jgi:hypothetical protein
MDINAENIVPILIVIFGILIALIILIYFLKVNKLSITAGKFKFTQDHKEHKDYPDYEDYVKEINKAFNDGITYKEQVELYISEMKKTIYDMMDIYIRSTIEILMNDYIALLKSQGIKDIGKSGDYVMFKWITDRLSPKLKDYVRKIIHENNILKLVNNNGWNDYIKTRISDAHYTSWEFLEQNYIRFDKVPLSDVKDKYNDSYDKFYDEATSYWDSIIKIKKEYKEIIDAVDEKYGAIYSITSHF